MEDAWVDNSEWSDKREISRWEIAPLTHILRQHPELRLHVTSTRDLIKHALPLTLVENDILVTEQNKDQVLLRPEVYVLTKESVEAIKKVLKI